MNNKLEEFYKNKNILVTGGAGFIGSHIVHDLLKLNAKITVLDNLSTGSLDNLGNIKEQINFVNGDITDFETCKLVTKDIEIIFHLAAFISVPESMKNPTLCNKTNIWGTFNLLEAARENKIKRFIFSSSSAVYGKTNKICNEDLNCSPTSVYGFSKLIGEQYCKQYNNLFNIGTICLRYFNVYGENQNPNGEYAAVVAKFNNCMQNNKPVTIFGNGLQTRDFIHVSQISLANLQLGMLPSNLMTGQAVNIASGNCITLLELFNKLKKQFPDYSREIAFLPARIGDIEYSQADCSLYEKLINFLQAP